MLTFILKDLRQKVEGMQASAVVSKEGLIVASDLSEGISEMHRLTREERLPAIDPYYHLYNYLYSAILPDDRDRNRMFEDRLTILGKAVKRMQERLTRNDSYEDKISYQRHNFWNKMLFEDARAHNLL